MAACVCRLNGSGRVAEAAELASIGRTLQADAQRLSHRAASIRAAVAHADQQAKDVQQQADTLQRLHALSQVAEPTGCCERCSVPPDHYQPNSLLAHAMECVVMFAMQELQVHSHQAADTYGHTAQLIFLHGQLLMLAAEMQGDANANRLRLHDQEVMIGGEDRCGGSCSVCLPQLPRS